MNAQDIYPYFLSYSSISIDTRKLEPGDLFFCLRGKEVNGNHYAKEALNKGASYVIMDDPDLKTMAIPDHKVFMVNNSLQCLQELAKIHRNQLKIPIIGITGSNGKTTTKELIKSVLSQKFTVFATQGNLNNHIGVPLSLLSIHKNHEMAVIEMGANHQKEIEFLCSLSMPHFGLITNIGKAHLEGFGGLEGVAKGKGELYAYLKENEGLALVYTGDKRLMELSAYLDRKLFYGTLGYEFTAGRILSEYPFLKVSWKDSLGEGSEGFCSSHLTGAYNLPNILAGICLGTYFGLSRNEIAKGIEEYIPHNQRSEVKKTLENEFILDYYNANPDSMMAALENFQFYPHSPKLVILGDMFELGDDAAMEHENIIQQVDKQKFEKKLLVGSQFFAFRFSYPGIAFSENIEEALLWLSTQNLKGFAILIKGSRGMKLENLLLPFNP